MLKQKSWVKDRVQISLLILRKLTRNDFYPPENIRKPMIF